MRVDAIVAGYTGGNMLYKNSGQFANGSTYYSDRDVHNHVRTVEQYEADLDFYKSEALRRGMSPILYNLKKEEDGSITYDMKKRSEAEVRALTREDLKGVDINSAPLTLQLANRQATMKTLDHVNHDINYFASEYVQYKSRITENYTGEKQKEKLEQLDKLMLSHVKGYVDEFSELTASFLSENGVGGEQKKIAKSLEDAFFQRAKEYTTFIQNNRDFAKLEGTAEEWLLHDNMYMGEQLRYAYATKSSRTHQNTETDRKYSMDDLAAIGTLVKETADVGYNRWRMGFINRHKSEEEFGTELGFTAMKYELLSETYDISPEVKGKLDTAFQQFVSNQNELAQKYVDKMREDPFVRTKEAYEKGWNEDIVKDVIRRMVGNMKTKDLNAAFKEDLSIVLKLYKDRTEDEETSNLSRYDPYHNSWEKSRYVDEWNQFVDRLALSSGENLQSYQLQDYISFLDKRR